MRYTTARAVLAGMCINVGITSLRMQYDGKDVYLRKMAESWRSGWWVVPSAVVAAVAGFVILWACVRDEGLNEREASK